MIEEYPTYHKGPCVLVLQKDQQGQPLHVVWGIPQHAVSPAVVVTAYRPDPARETIYTQVFDIMHTATFKSPPWPPGIAARGYNNAFAQEWHGRENALREHRDQLIPSYAVARQHRDLHTAPAYFGESASFVHAIRTAEEVLCSICEEAECLLRQRAMDLIQ